LNSIRGLMRVTGQPVLTFNVADVAAETLAQQIFSCCWSNTLDALSSPPSTSFALLRTAPCRSARNWWSRVWADRVTFSSVVKNHW
jgi:hypothetical protein